MIPGRDSLKTKKTLNAGGAAYAYYSLAEAGKQIGDISRLPFSLKVLLENLLRFEDDRSVTADDIKAFADWLKEGKSTREIAYRPARVLMQDFTGVPAVVDLAAMRDAVKKRWASDPDADQPPFAGRTGDRSLGTWLTYFGGPPTPSDEECAHRVWSQRNGERYKFPALGPRSF